jgi:hypothetical protein
MSFSFVNLLVDPRFHASVVLLVALVRVVYAIVSRLVAPYPRARAVVEGLAALGPDVLRAGQQFGAAFVGRPVPSLDLRSPVTLDARTVGVGSDAEGSVYVTSSTASLKLTPERARRLAEDLLASVEAPSTITPRGDVGASHDAPAVAAPKEP